MGRRRCARASVVCCEFAALIPGARVEMIQSAGHVPQIEQRKVVSEHLQKFLSD